MEISFRNTVLIFIGVVGLGYLVYIYGLNNVINKSFKVLNFFYTVFIFAYLFVMLSALIDYTTLTPRGTFNIEEFLFDISSETDYTNPRNTGNKDWNYVQSIIKSNPNVEKFFNKDETLIDSITQEEIKDEYVYTIDECHNDYITEDTLKNLYGPGKRFHSNMRNPFTNQSLKSITKYAILN